MTSISKKTRQGFLKRFLDPIDRLTEAIYAVLIVMTFTMAYRAIDFAGVNQKVVSEAVLSLAVAAFGCAFAWGIIDGMMFILLGMMARGEDGRLLKKVLSAPDEQTAIGEISDQLDETLELAMTADERQDLYRQAYLRMRDNEPKPVGFKREEFYGAVGVVVIAVLASLPLVLPLLILRTNVDVALRASNAMAILMLFIFGYQWGKHAQSKPVRMGLLLAGLGLAMVLIAIPLGG